MKWFSILGLLVALGCLLHSSNTAAESMADSSMQEAEPLRLSSFPFGDRGILLSQLANRPSGRVLLRLEWLRVEKPDINIFDPTEEERISASKGVKGYLVLQLIERSLSAPLTERVIWVGYLSEQLFVLPAEPLGAALTEALEKGHLLLVLNAAPLSPLVNLIVYEVDLNTTIAAGPLAFDPKRQDLWPSEPKPLENFASEVSVNGGASIERIEASLTGRQLLVVGLLDGQAKIPVAFTLDLDSFRWMQLNYRPIGKR
jgi:hypothetical protein